MAPLLANRDPYLGFVACRDVGRLVLREEVVHGLFVVGGGAGGLGAGVLAQGDVDH
jgi:hypothetical protein